MTDANDVSCEPPLWARFLCFLLFWPTDKLVNNRFVAPYFRSKYSIIILLPLMCFFPFFFWGLIAALVVAVLTAFGIII